MLGRHHLTLSLATVSLVVLPVFALAPEATILVLVGAAIGSLIPDADSPDAAIFHDEVRGLKGGASDLANAPGVLYPVFGYVTKYLIYKPAVRFYDAYVFERHDIAERHRGFSHSFLGLGTMATMTAVYLLPVLWSLGLVWLVGLGAFFAGYLAGALLHLLQDSCTKTGIQWNFPFQSWRLQGQLTTTARPEDVYYQRGFLTVLGAAAFGMFLAPSLLETVPVLLLSLGGLALAVVCWSVFAVGIARCRLSPS